MIRMGFVGYDENGARWLLLRWGWLVRMKMGLVGYDENGVGWL